MKTSESIIKIAPALLRAQKGISFASKDATNPHFKSRYADLPAVIDAVKSALNDNGIVFLQSATDSEAGILRMTTRLIHESGEWIEDTATMPISKLDPQGFGSAMTYARRYCLAAITGLYQDDDDGNAASGIKQSSKSVAKDTLGNLNEEVQQYVKDEAQKVLAHLPDEDAMFDAYQATKSKLDADEQVAFWGFFDSKSRSALKKIGEQRKGK